MIDKYFGFTKIQDEYSVVDSLLEHVRIDSQELSLLSALHEGLKTGNSDEVESNYEKIKKISQDSTRVFEHISEQIIQANFDHQKQYDLLRLYQRIESFSSAILASAHSGIILARIDTKVPAELLKFIQEMNQHCLTLQQKFETALVEYQKNRKNVIHIIHKIVDLELYLHQKRTECLEQLYLLGNDGKLKIGDFRAIENLVDAIATTGHSIVEASTSLEWLLMS